MLRFQIGPVPVAVQPLFWVLALVLGFGYGITGIAVAIWTGVVFLSVLMHELGHAVTLRGFGYQPAVVLHMIGGFTTWHPQEQLAPARRIVTTLAGPATGFALAAGAWALRTYTPLGESDRLISDALWWLFLVNLIWGVFNLIPIRGLDGGQAVGGLADLVFRRHGRIVAEAVYVVTGLAAIVFGVVNEMYLLAIFAAVLTFGGYLGRGSAARPEPAPAGDVEPGPPRLGI